MTHDQAAAAVLTIDERAREVLEQGESPYRLTDDLAAELGIDAELVKECIADTIERASVLQETRATAQPRHPRLAESPMILGLFREAVRLRGVVGESATAATLYLAITSRLLDKPVSIAVKGPSSAGKSWEVERVKDFFPEGEVIDFTSMSAKAMIYSAHDFRHRTVLFYEVHGMRDGADDDPTAYILRTLLSEGRIVHEVTVGTPGAGFSTERIVKNGPTNVLFTTTKLRVHPENETRCLSLNVDDSPEQTRAILRFLASERETDVDLRPWHALQRWLREADRRVAIPFAGDLAERVPPVAVRLRRDFSAVLSLVRAHAAIHQLHRERDDDGRIVATLEDYQIVRDLIADVVSEGVEATVSPSVRETVEAVVEHATTEGITAAVLAQHLRIDRSNATRRLRRADRFVVNLEDKRGRPGRWVPGEPMPDELDVLPAVAQLEEAARNRESQATEGDPGSGCAVAPGSARTDTEGEL